MSANIERLATELASLSNDDRELVRRVRPGVTVVEILAHGMKRSDM